MSNAPTPIKVHVLIESYSGEQHIVQHAQGDLYPKGNHYYLRYEETDPEMKGVVTTIRLEGDSIRIIRQGSLRSEQSFIAGHRLQGYYDTQQGKLALETATDALVICLTGGVGTVEWSYDLYVMEEMSGTYKLRLTITERE
jgi:uncharacterized beta-barrel protein YwiB (DUF1934 family)